MNNLKKTAMGLMVGAMAIGFSAFTNAPGKRDLNTRYWINDPTSNQYIEYTSGVPDVASNCGDPSEFSCVVTSDNPTINPSFDKTDAASLGVTPVTGSSEALYQE